MYQFPYFLISRLPLSQAILDLTVVSILQPCANVCSERVQRTRRFTIEASWRARVIRIVLSQSLQLA